MEQIVLFILSFLLVLIFYEIFIVKRAKKNYKKKDYKEVVEIKYLISRYKLNIKKVNYFQLLQIVAIVSSFDISLIVTLMMLSKNFFVELGIVLVTTIPIIMGSYHFVYLFYKKKGLIENV